MRRPGIVVVTCIFSTEAAFTKLSLSLPKSRSPSRCFRPNRQAWMNRAKASHASKDDESKSIIVQENNNKVDDPRNASVQVSSELTTTNTDQDKTSYPLNVPSPILLGSSMIMAIASIGSIFELAGGIQPKFGFEITAAIAALGLPSCLFLFYAAIRKGMAETEEDDEKFLKGDRS